MTVLGAIGGDQLGRGRGRVERTPDGVQVVLPAPRPPLYVAFLGVWTAFAAFALASTVGQSSSGPVVPAVFVCIGVGMLAWMLGGRETLVAGASEIVLRRAIGPAGRTWRFQRDGIADLRVSEGGGNAGQWGRRSTPWSAGAGSIAFDYGARTYRLGAGIDEAEAKQIVRTLREEGVGA